MAKIRHRKKILMASLLIGILMIGSIVSIVLVLASTNQRITTNVTIRYTVDGVAANVRASYSIIPVHQDQNIRKVSMNQKGTANSNVDFDMQEDTVSKEISPEVDIELNTMNQRVVFEYAFTNKAASSFTVTLGDLESNSTIENMNIFYHVSSRQMTEVEYRNSFSQTTLGMQAITEANQTLYIYVCIEVDDETEPAGFETIFDWALLKNDTISISLDNNGGSGSTTMKAIPNAIMPPLKQLPTLEGKAFGGYYYNGVQYINENGVGVRACPATPITLTASWTDNPFIIDNGTLVKMTSAGENQTNITIPRSVETIAENAFAGNETLTSVTFDGTSTYADSSEGLKTIGARAFSNCINLKTINLPNGLKTINNFAFEFCKSLTEITIPESVVALGSQALYSTHSLEKLYFNAKDSVNISGGNILDNTGYYNYQAPDERKLEIIIGENVRVIPEYFCTGDDVYSDCDPNIKSISFASNSMLKKISDYAFHNCPVEELIIPEGVTEIGEGALQEMKNLTNLVIPSTVTSLPDAILKGCERLDTLEFPGVIEDGIFECYGDDKDFSAIARLFSYGTFDEIYYHYFYSKSSVPESLTKLRVNSGRIPGSFISYNSNIEVTLLEGVTSIGKMSFGNLNGLTTIELPNSITTIEDWAFMNCFDLESITIPGNVTNIGYHIFAECYELTSITISYGVTSIVDSMFSGCSKIETILIPESVTSIGGWAFSNCTGLTEVTIPDSVTSIEDAAFSNCTGLTEVTIGNSVTTIGDDAFYGCASLTDLIIPSSVTSIGSSAFNDCESLTNVNFEENSQLKSIGECAFYRCSSIKQLIIPEGVTEIGEGAFQEMTNLKNLVIPSTVTSLEEACLMGCDRLEKLELPLVYEGVYSYYEYEGDNYTLKLLFSHFEYNGDGGYNIDGSVPTTLSEVVVNAGNIGRMMFIDCPNLTSITIKNGITQIGDYAFNECSKITEVIIPNSVVSIGRGAFKNCTSLSRVVLSNSLTTILGEAFYNCKSLASIELPSSLKIIGEVYVVEHCVFDGCSLLSELVIPESVEYVSGLGDSNITQIIFEDSTGWTAYGDMGEVIEIINLEQPFIDDSYVNHWYWYVQKTK